VSERGVIDLEDRAGVVAEVAQQPEIELDAVRDATLADGLVGGREPARRALHGRAAELVRPLEDLGASAHVGQSQQRLALGVADL
jgi:hypothetical protein